MKNYLLITTVLIAAPMFSKIESFQSNAQRGGVNLQNVINTGNTILNGGGVKLTNDEAHILLYLSLIQQSPLKLQFLEVFLHFFFYLFYI
jgi:hypothetical protein